MGREKLEVQFEPHYVPPTWPPSADNQLMMMHLDIAVDDFDLGIAWALECGAVLADHQPQDDVKVFKDPDGHPFCIFLASFD